MPLPFSLIWTKVPVSNFFEKDVEIDSKRGTIYPTRRMMMQKLTKEQAVVVSAFTGTLICEFSDMHAEIEKRLGRSVMTHELGSTELNEKLVKPAFRDDFIALFPETDEVG